MNGIFYVIGVGPGDPELLTLKALRILNECEVLIVPKGREDGNSTALGIIEPNLNMANKEIIEVYFPMKKIHMGQEPDSEVNSAWQFAAREISKHIRAGRKVAFPTLGDPAIYSTGFYTCQTLLAIEPDITTRIIPGVSAISACSAATGVPLCLGDDMMAVVPATFNNDKLQDVLNTFQTVVLMKVHRVMPRIVQLLGSLDILNNAVLVERTAQNSERIIHDLSAISPDELHYFSTIIVRK